MGLNIKVDYKFNERDKNVFKNGTLIDFKYVKNEIGTHELVGIVINEEGSFLLIQYYNLFFVK